MATITKFEELDVWKLSREIVNDIYAKTTSNEFNRDFALRDQIRRSSIGVLSNIAEGFESGSDKQFVRYLNIAKGSAGECRAQLYIALDQNYVSKQEFKDIQRKLMNCSGKISKLISYLNSDNKVSDFEIKYGIR